MFIGSYEFSGDPEVLLAAYDRLMAAMPPDAIDLHVCVAGDDGITVLDACPSQEVFVAFSGSAEFAAAVQQAGLPTPVVTPLGDVHRARTIEWSWKSKPTKLDAGKRSASRMVEPP
jgi:hypothetical protein